MAPQITIIHRVVSTDLPVSLGTSRTGVLRDPTRVLVAAMASPESICSGNPALSSGVNARAYFSRAVYFRLVLVFLSFPYLVDEKAPVNSVSFLLRVAMPFECERESRLAVVSARLLAEHATITP